MRLSRYGIIAGPSSGEALHGLLAYLQRMKTEDRLPELADPSTGEISCAFICADLPYQYMDMYYKKLSNEEFPPIYNEVSDARFCLWRNPTTWLTIPQNLLHCDQDAYDERWFLEPNEAASHLLLNNNFVENAVCSAASSCLCAMQPLSFVNTPSSISSMVSDSSSSDSVVSSSSIFSVVDYPTSKPIVSPEITVLDLRPEELYAASHICGSRNIPLPLTKANFYGDAKAVEQRWLEMKQAFEQEDWVWAYGRRALVLCADGDSGRMATAMLRAKGCEATCVEGGYPALVEYLDVCR